MLIPGELCLLLRGVYCDWCVPLIAPKPTSSYYTGPEELAATAWTSIIRFGAQHVIQLAVLGRKDVLNKSILLRTVCGGATVWTSIIRFGVQHVHIQLVVLGRKDVQNKSILLRTVCGGATIVWSSCIRHRA